MNEEETKRMSLKEFWIRFGIWIVFFLVAPFTYIAVEFGIFKEQSQRSVSGWGIIGIAFIGVCFIVILNMIRKTMRAGELPRQCLDGLLAISPLIFALIAIESIKNNISDFEHFLVFLIICEAIAIPVNPFPKWEKEHDIEEKENFLIRVYRKTFGKDKS